MNTKPKFADKISVKLKRMVDGKLVTVQTVGNNEEEKKENQNEPNA